MQFLHLPEALTLGINKHFAWAQIQTAMLDLDQLRALTGNNQEKALCREWLQQKEEKKLQTLHYDKRHIEWLGGRICAKQAARHYLLAGGGQGNLGNMPGRAALHASNILVMSGASGRPFLAHSGLPEDPPLPHISISHSRRYGVAVAASSHCGIDIQAGSDSLIRVKDRFCSREEEAILGQDLKELQESDHLTLLWAAKEAVKKGAFLERMPGFLDLALTSIETQTMVAPVSLAPRLDEKRPTAKDGRVSLAPWMDEERPTASPDSFLFTLTYQDSLEEQQQNTGHSHHHFQVVVGLHQGYGIGLCVIPAQPGGDNA